jgi:hypothetical protein
MEFDNELPHFHRKLFNEIYDNKYFIESFEKVCMNFDGSGNAYALQDEKVIRLFWFEFLCSLEKLKDVEIFNKITNMSSID